MTIRRRLAFAAAAVLLALSVPLGMLLAADIYFHHRVERFAGVNVWGYRGPRVSRKRPGEHRLVMIGGSTAFGYGVNYDQAIPACLEQRLRPLSRLETAAQVSAALYRQLDRFAAVAPVSDSYADVHVPDFGCTGHVAHYCASVAAAIRFALDHHKKTLVVTQPYLSDRHREQQAQLRTMIASRFSGNPEVSYIDLGDAIDLERSRLVYDTMHLTAEGNALIASRLVPPLAALMPEAFDTPSALEGRR